MVPAAMERRVHRIPIRAAAGCRVFESIVSAAIKIEISDPVTPDVVHRFRNFGEDIYRALRETCSVDLGEIDASTNSFVVRDICRSDIGEVTQTIKRQLKHHGFEASARLTRI